jgi:hypothetical protein|uniref:Uncharacterized protein n=1 Tax=Siphoviridae sp. ctSA812 TaxID=2825508 RepID=A0A8S5U3H4_9CAUD|nr:MAG TPA: hypothetical protein [Siphoviridae sp. ctSA812]
MDQPGLRHKSLIGTREHIGTANSYLSVYNTHFFIYLIFVHEIYDVIGFFCVPRVPTVDNKGFFGTGTACGFLFGDPAGRFFYAVTVGVEFLGSE